MADKEESPNPEHSAYAERRSRLRNESTSALLNQALALSRDDSESDERWDVVWTLRERSDAEAFDAATRWRTSEDVTERELAADLLGLFFLQRPNDGDYVYPFRDRAVPLLEELLDDPEPRVIASALSGLGHYWAFEPILARLSLAKHSSADVRYAVACGLAGCEAKAAIDTLIALSADEDDEIRDWATFGLGTQCDFDTPEIRMALLERVDDPGGDTGGEALLGLARRKDTGVVQMIRKALGNGWDGTLILEAAAQIASPELVPDLEELSANSADSDDYYRSCLETALNRCKGISDAEENERWAQDEAATVPPWAKNEPGP